MRAFIKNYIAAEKARREEEDREGGFSLIELIIVVVILGILIAIAIPIFLNVQANAEKAAVQTAAANGAMVIASELSGGKIADQTAADAFLASLKNDDITSVVATQFGGANGDLTKVCVTAQGYGKWQATAGTACATAVGALSAGG